MRNNKFIPWAFSSAIIISFVVGCQTKTEPVQDVTDSIQDTIIQETHEQHDTTDCKTTHWTYDTTMEEGQDNWKNLCSDFTACGGVSQSPIDITGAVVTDTLKPIQFSYTTSKVDIVNNGHTVQFNISEGNKATIAGKEYQLVQFHFHSGSEHTIEKHQYPLEVHFVHKHSDSDYAVIGIMFEEGASNALLAKYLKNFPTEKGEFTVDSTFNVLSILPKNKSYYHYSGSLTTPPCSEVVSWYVLTSPIKATKEQIKMFSDILHNNFRSVMPLNNRTIYKYVQK